MTVLHPSVDRSSVRPLVQDESTTTAVLNESKRNTGQQVAINPPERPGQAPVITPRVLELNRQVEAAPLVLPTPSRSAAPQLPANLTVPLAGVGGEGRVWRGVPAGSALTDTRAVGEINRFIEANGLQRGLPAGWSAGQRDRFSSLVVLSGLAVQQGQSTPRQLHQDLPAIFELINQGSTRLPALNPTLNVGVNRSGLAPLPTVVAQGGRVSPASALNDRVVNGDLATRLTSVDFATSREAYVEAYGLINQLPDAAQRVPVAINLDRLYLGSIGQRETLALEGGRRELYTQLAGQVQAASPDKAQALAAAGNLLLRATSDQASVKVVQKMFAADTNTPPQLGSLTVSVAGQRISVDRDSIASVRASVDESLAAAQVSWDRLSRPDTGNADPVPPVEGGTGQPLTGGVTPPSSQRLLPPAKEPEPINRPREVGIDEAETTRIETFSSRGQSRQIAVGRFDNLPAGVQQQLPLLLKNANPGWYGDSSLTELASAFRNNSVISAVTLNEDVKVPAGTTLKSWALVPEGAVVPKGTVLGKDMTLGDGSVLKAATPLADNLTLRAAAVLPAGTVLGGELTLPAGTLGGAAAMTNKMGMSTSGELKPFFELERVIGNPAVPNAGTQAAVDVVKTVEAAGGSWWAMTNNPSTFAGAYSDRGDKVNPDWAVAYNRFGEQDSSGKNPYASMWFDKSDPNSGPSSIDGISIFNGMYPDLPRQQYLDVVNNHPDQIGKLVPEAMVKYNQARAELGLSPVTLASRIMFGGGPDKPAWVWEGDNDRALGGTASGGDGKVSLTRTWGVFGKPVNLSFDPSVLKAPGLESGNAAFVNPNAGKDETFTVGAPQPEFTPFPSPRRLQPGDEPLFPTVGDLVPSAPPGERLKLSADSIISTVLRMPQGQLQNLPTLLLLEARAGIAAKAERPGAQEAIQRIDGELERRGDGPGNPPPTPGSTPPKRPGDGEGTPPNGSTRPEPPPTDVRSYQPTPTEYPYPVKVDAPLRSGAPPGVDSSRINERLNPNASTAPLVPDNLNPQGWPVKAEGIDVSLLNKQDRELMLALGKGVLGTAVKQHLILPVTDTVNEKAIKPFLGTEFGRQVLGKAWAAQDLSTAALDTLSKSQLGRDVAKLYDYTIGSPQARAAMQRFASGSSDLVSKGMVGTAAFIVAGVPGGQTHFHDFVIDKGRMTPEQTQLAGLLGLPDGYRVQVAVRDVPGTEAVGGKAILFTAEAKSALLLPGTPGQRGTSQPGISPVTNSPASPVQPMAFASSGGYGPNVLGGYRLGTQNLFVAETRQVSLGAATVNVPLIRLGNSTTMTPDANNPGNRIVGNRGPTASFEASLVPIRVVSVQRVGLGPLQWLMNRYSGPVNGIGSLSTEGGKHATSSTAPFYSTTSPFITGSTSFKPNSPDVQAAQKAVDGFIKSLSPNDVKPAVPDVPQPPKP